MKNFILAGLLTMTTSLAVSVSAHAEVLTLAVSKMLLHQKNEAYSMLVQPIDAEHGSDKEYVAQANKVNNEFKTCMNPDTPPGGSPVAKFYRYKSPQLGDFCKKLTVAQCIDKVHGQQIEYCTQKVKLNTTDTTDKIHKIDTLAQAVPHGTTPGTSGNGCDDVKNHLKRLIAEKSALEARKKRLEAEIIRTFGEMAAHDAEFNRLRQDAEKQCGN